jgi:hypothetical protein
MIKTIETFVDTLKTRQVEIYNEFSLQHELGIFLRSRLVDQKIQFERNVSFFFQTGEFIKKEIDISVFATDNPRLRCAIELKFPRNGQYPEQMFSFCKDLRFAEQLKQSGFEQTFLVVFADDRRFYSGNGDGIYGYFRQGRRLCGAIQKPTGNRDETVTLKGSYQVQWNGVFDSLKFTIIEALANPKNGSGA